MAEDRGRPAGRSEGRREGSAAGGAAPAASGGKYMALGLQFVLSILLFLYLGRWLDRRLGTAPWLLIGGVFLGAGASFYSMYRQLMGDLRREEREREARRAGSGRGGPA